jgi:hypothetical protein
VSRDRHFFEGVRFQGLAKAFHYYFTIINFLLAYLKLLTKFGKGNVVARCSLVPTSHWLQEKCARISMSLDASGMILQNHWQLPV